jgi:NAD(P)-dependent dehydrogenase (short-subunit alcohol dehydrogenase family)
VTKASCRFDGKVAVVTGSAGGIGRAALTRLAEEGATVVALDLDGDLAGETARDVAAATGSAAYAHGVDVSSAASVEAAIRHVLDEVGRVDVLVQAAGVTTRVPYLDLTEQEWDRVIDVNLKGTFLVGQRCARLMKEQQSGAIVNVASIAAQVVRREGFSAYNASKAGVQALTKAMAAALGAHNVRVNAVGPGPIRTSMTADRMAQPGGEESLLTGVIQRRIGLPEDVAAAIAFLASDEADFVTGTTLYVDGGVLVGTAVGE